MKIQEGNGLVWDAQILSLEGNRMCLGIKGSADAEHLNLVERRWVSEGGDEVTFCFPLGGLNPLPRQ